MNNTKLGKAAIHINIRKLMKGRKRGLKCFEIRNLYIVRFHRRYSDSAFSARLREMRDIKCDLSNYTYLLV